MQQARKRFKARHAKGGMTRKNVFLPQAMIEFVDNQVDATGTNISEVLRRSVTLYSKLDVILDMWELVTPEPSKRVYPIHYNADDIVVSQGSRLAQLRDKVEVLVDVINGEEETEDGKQT